MYVPKLGNIPEAATPRPTTTWVLVGELHIDPAYQRQLSEKKVRDIVENFDADVLGILKANRRPDGTLWITDGQHRLEALRRMGVRSVEVQLTYKNTTADEADQFVTINTRRGPVSTYDRWRARRVQGDGVVLDIDNILAQFDLYAGKRSNRTDTKVFGSLSFIEELYEQEGRDFVRRCLGVLRDAFAPDPDTYSHLLFAGVAHFLAVAVREVQDFDPDELIRKLRQTTPDDIMRRANAFMKAYGGHHITAAALEILNTYNHRRREENKLPVSLVLNSRTKRAKKLRSDEA